MAIDTATGKEAPAEISSERVKDIFSTIAKKYERFNAVSSFGAYKTWLAGMMKQAPISANDDVLEIAGGPRRADPVEARKTHHRSPGRGDVQHRVEGSREGPGAHDPIQQCRYDLHVDSAQAVDETESDPVRPGVEIGGDQASQPRRLPAVGGVPRTQPHNRAEMQ